MNTPSRDPAAIGRFLSAILRHGCWTIAPEGNEPFMVHPTSNDDTYQVALTLSDADLVSLYDPRLPVGASNRLVGYHWPPEATANLMSRIAYNHAWFVGIDGSVVVTADPTSVLVGLRASGLDVGDPVGYDAVVAVVEDVDGVKVLPATPA